MYGAKFSERMVKTLLKELMSRHPQCLAFFQIVLALVKKQKRVRKTTKMRLLLVKFDGRNKAFFEETTKHFFSLFL